MITAIHIKHFVTIETLDLEFTNGLTTVTGETGAGKSIIMGALGLVLGDRADAKSVRKGHDQADIQSCSDIEKIPTAIDVAF